MKRKEIAVGKRRRDENEARFAKKKHVAMIREILSKKQEEEQING